MDAEEVAKKSQELLEKQGYVVWKCHELNDEKITIVKTKLNGGYPTKYKVYTVQQLIRLCGSSVPQTVFELNKLGVEVEEEN